jgi:hypothetical protein
MSKFNKRVSELLNEAGYTSAALKSGAKSFGKKALKALNPLTLASKGIGALGTAVKGAQAVATAPQKFGQALKGAVVDNDYSPLSNSLGNISQKLGTAGEKINQGISGGIQAVKTQRDQDIQKRENKIYQGLIGTNNPPRPGNKISFYNVPGMVENGISVGSIKEVRPYKNGYVYTVRVNSGKPDGPDTANIVYSKDSSSVEVFYSKKNVPMPNLTMNTVLTPSGKGSWSISQPEYLKPDRSSSINATDVTSGTLEVGKDIVYRQPDGSLAKGVYLGYSDMTGKKLRVIRK